MGDHGYPKVHEKPKMVSISEPVVLLDVTGGEEIRRDVIGTIQKLGIDYVFSAPCASYGYSAYFRESDAKKIVAVLVVEFGYKVK